MACIDQAPATAEYKLLQLRQYLRGDALKAIDGLGHSAAAYDAAKARLDRKYGGERRRVATHLEAIQQFAPVRPGNTDDLDRFADLIDVTVVNLKDAGRTAELGNSTFYQWLQKKLPETLLTQYQRWGLRAGQGRLSGESADMGLPGVRISSHRNRDNSRTRCQAPRCNSNTAAGASPSTSTNTLCREADVCGTTAVRSVQRTARGVGLSHTPATRQQWTVGAHQAGGSVLPVPWERPHRDGLQEDSTVRHQRLHEDAPPSSASTASQAIRIEQQPTSNSKHRERSGTRHGRGCACSHHDRPLTDVNASGPSNGASHTPQWTTFSHRQRSSRRRQHPVVPQLGRRSRTRHPGRVEATHGGHAKRADQNISDNASPRPAGKLRLNVSLRASRDNRWSCHRRLAGGGLAGERTAVAASPDNPVSVCGKAHARRRAHRRRPSRSTHVSRRGSRHDRRADRPTDATGMDVHRSTLSDSEGMRLLRLRADLLCPEAETSRHRAQPPRSSAVGGRRPQPPGATTSASHKARGRGSPTSRAVMHSDRRPLPSHPAMERRRRTDIATRQLSDGATPAWTHRETSAARPRDRRVVQPDDSPVRRQRLHRQSGARQRSASVVPSALRSTSTRQGNDKDPHRVRRVRRSRWSVTQLSTPRRTEAPTRLSRSSDTIPQETGRSRLRHLRDVPSDFSRTGPTPVPSIPLARPGQRPTARCVRVSTSRLRRQRIPVLGAVRQTAARPHQCRYFAPRSRRRVIVYLHGRHDDIRRGQPHRPPTVRRADNAMAESRAAREEVAVQLNRRPRRYPSSRPSGSTQLGRRRAPTVCQDTRPPVEIGDRRVFVQLSTSRRQRSSRHKTFVPEADCENLRSTRLDNAFHRPCKDTSAADVAGRLWLGRARHRSTERPSNPLVLRTASPVDSDSPSMPSSRQWCTDRDNSARLHRCLRASLWRCWVLTPRVSKRKRLLPDRLVESASSTTHRNLNSKAGVDGCRHRTSYRRGHCSSFLQRQACNPQTPHQLDQHYHCQQWECQDFSTSSQLVLRLIFSSNSSLFAMYYV